MSFSKLCQNINVTIKIGKVWFLTALWQRFKKEGDCCFDIDTAHIFEGETILMLKKFFSPLFHRNHCYLFLNEEKLLRHCLYNKDIFSSKISTGGFHYTIFKVCNLCAWFIMKLLLPSFLRCSLLGARKLKPIRVQKYSFKP